VGLKKKSCATNIKFTMNSIKYQTIPSRSKQILGVTNSGKSTSSRMEALLVFTIILLTTNDFFNRSEAIRKSSVNRLTPLSPNQRLLGLAKVPSVRGKSKSDFQLASSSSTNSVSGYDGSFIAQEHMDMTHLERLTEFQSPHLLYPVKGPFNTSKLMRSDWTPSPKFKLQSKGRKNQFTRSTSGGEHPPQPLSQQSREGSLKCALILQRTYVKKLPGSNQNEDYDDSQEGGPMVRQTGKQERICITYADVNKAIAEAKQRRGFTSIAQQEVNSIEPSPPVIAELGELNQEVTRLLARKFDLSADEILNGLPLINMSRTDFWPICPLMVKPVRCDPTGRFRSFTGHCNNLKHPAWGAAQTPFVRFLAPRHPDGIQAERTSVVDGSSLPSPRLVTSIVHRDHDQPSSELSLLIMVWGQIVDHDVALAAPPRGKLERERRN